MKLLPLLPIGRKIRKKSLNYTWAKGIKKNNLLLTLTHLSILILTSMSKATSLSETLNKQMTHNLRIIKNACLCIRIIMLIIINLRSWKKLILSHIYSQTETSLKCWMFMVGSLMSSKSITMKTFVNNSIRCLKFQLYLGSNMLSKYFWWAWINATMFFLIRAATISKYLKLNKISILKALRTSHRSLKLRYPTKEVERSKMG